MIVIETKLLLKWFDWRRNDQVLWVICQFKNLQSSKPLSKCIQWWIKYKCILPSKATIHVKDITSDLYFKEFFNSFKFLMIVRYFWLFQRLQSHRFQRHHLRGVLQLEYMFLLEDLWWTLQWRNNALVKI